MPDTTLGSAPGLDARPTIGRDPAAPRPVRDDVLAAARWLSGRVVRTPVLWSPVIDELAGARILVKAENLQAGGSYKMRGALVAVGRAAAAGTHTGVVAQSTGNHAVAVALAARQHGLVATVVLPVDAAPSKVAAARAAGAEIVLAGTTVADRSAVARQISESTGFRLIDAYDDPDVVAGQGTASLELIEQARELGIPVDAVVVPVGGGGGVAGACLAAAGSAVAVYGVEPVGCDSLARSLAAGSPVTVEPGPTLADGLRPSRVGALPFALVRGKLAGVRVVDDDAIAEALRLALLHLKLLVEPSAAAGLAGALAVAAADGHSTIGVVLTGGNIEPGLLARLTADGLSMPARREGTAACREG
ncbi:threonine/serine dehydratase [Rugosimonospora acidiphila]|uniref:Threonine/serine dehydratase n=1 Tax=Rugosimonospora acidiphila TaxID=556531 RepID=A0ABP9S311_9ACTN